MLKQFTYNCKLRIFLHDYFISRHVRLVREMDSFETTISRLVRDKLN